MGIEILVYLLFVGAVIYSVYAQIKVSSTFRKYRRTATSAGRTAAEVARRMLDGAGLYHVRIERVRGSLTDHYDPRGEVLRLSEGVYDSTSAASVGVAAHEAGHALQHATGYGPLRLRSLLVPLTGFASRASWLFILLGCLIMAFTGVVGDFGYLVTLAGVGLFGVTTLFQLVTLPCEFNASARAMQALRQSGEYTKNDLYGAKQVLSAAAMTYVAALAVSFLQLLRLLLMVRRNRR